MQLVNVELNLFCPRKSCCFFQDSENPITQMGIYPVQCEGTRRQLFWCHGGHHKFSETGYSNLWGIARSLSETLVL